MFAIVLLLRQCVVGVFVEAHLKLTVPALPRLFIFLMSGLRALIAKPVFT